VGWQVFLTYFLKCEKNNELDNLEVAKPVRGHFGSAESALAIPMSETGSALLFISVKIAMAAVWQKVT